jgi:very-short-patch-repair endonuclease
VTPDEICARTAEGQFGIFWRDQALKAGLTPRLLRYRAATGKLTELLPGIYRPAGTPPSWHQRLLGAQIWAGPQSAACGPSAAILWNIENKPPDIIEVVTTRNLVAPVPWLRVHKAELKPRDIRKRNGIAVTNIERTVFDLAAISWLRAEAAIDTALGRRLTTIDRLNDYSRSFGANGRAGSRVMKKLLVEMTETAPSIGRFERKLFRALQDARVPLPVRQHPVRNGQRTYYLDFAYPDALLGIEAQSYKHHSERPDWEKGHLRHNTLSSTTWTILYITWRELRDHPDRVIATILKTLKSRSLRLFDE